MTRSDRIVRLQYNFKDKREDRFVHLLKIYSEWYSEEYLEQYAHSDT